MTATLYPSQRTDRITPRRASNGASNGVSNGFTGTSHRSANYAARRAVAALLVLMVAGLAVTGVELIGASIDVGGRPAAASVGAAAEVPGVRTHVAQPGDTLWSIADRYRGGVGHRRFVDALIDVNGGTVIQIGQAVRLP